MMPGKANRMETHTFFLQLLIILVAARLFAEIAVRLGAPAVIGELTAGIILGPSLLGWIQPNEIIRYLAEIGILLLLFEVGLDTDMRKLMSTSKSSAIVALGGFIIPFVLGYLLASLAFGLSTLVSLFIGGALTATSIGITLRVLSDLGQRNSREGQIVLGAAVLDDVLGVVLLALLYEFSIAGGITLVNTGKVLAFITLFFLVAPVAAKLISVIIKRVDDASDLPGLIPTAMVSLVLLFAWLAHKMGAPELLGGFAAGLALSRRFFLSFGIALHTETEFSERIEAQMRPIIQLFTPIFFVMVGLSLNLHAEPAGGGLVLHLHLGLLLPLPAGGHHRQVQRCPAHGRTDTPAHRHRCSHGSKGRGRPDLRRAGPHQRHLRQQYLCRHDHGHRLDHPAAALRIEEPVPQNRAPTTANTLTSTVFAHSINTEFLRSWRLPSASGSARPRERVCAACSRPPALGSTRTSWSPSGGC